MKRIVVRPAEERIDLDSIFLECIIGKLVMDMNAVSGHGQLRLAKTSGGRKVRKRCGHRPARPEANPAGLQASRLNGPFQRVRNKNAHKKSSINPKIHILGGIRIDGKFLFSRIISPNATIREWRYPHRFLRHKDAAVFQDMHQEPAPAKRGSLVHLIKRESQIF